MPFPHYAWLIWSLILVVIWAIVRSLLKSPEIRHEMLVVSIFTSFFGFTEPLFVPAYWNPPSLFNLAQTTGFDLESFIFTFGAGGLAYALYMAIFPVTHEPEIPVPKRISERHKYHLPLLLAAPAIFFFLLLVTRINPIYCAIICCLIGGGLTWYCRPDLVGKMVVSALVFTGIYFVYFTLLTGLFPGYVEQVWNLPAISGILLFGIPIEELAFAFSFGFYWSTVYEHFTWKKIPDRYNVTFDLPV